jgi:hypothetical protein
MLSSVINSTKYKNALYKQNVQCLNVKPCGTQSKPLGFKRLISVFASTLQQRRREVTQRGVYYWH